MFIVYCFKLLFLFFLFYCTNCYGKTTVDDNSIDLRIMDGEQAEENSTPFIVAISIINVGFICAGSIVEGSNRTIVTAAHCVANTTKERLVIGVGSTTYLNMMKYYVEEIIINPDYNSYTNNDIALIYLSEDLTFDDRVATISLEKTFIGSCVEATIFGWGWTSYPIGMSTDDLNRIDTATISVSKCSQFWNETTIKQICTLKPGTGACRGDSGGPVVWNDKLIGIVSWGNAVCGSNYPDVHTRICFYYNWIRTNLK